MEKFDEKKPKEIQFKGGSGVDGCVKILQDYKKRGESVFGRFNSTILYSDNVTLDSAYREIYGKSRAEYINNVKKMEKELAVKKSIARANIQTWIKEGEKHIYPERLEEWKKCVEYNANNIYNGKDLATALEIMKYMDSDKGSISLENYLKVSDTYEHLQNNIVNIVFLFSKSGPEFCEQFCKNTTPEFKKLIEEKKQENAELAKKHEKDSINSPERREEEQKISKSVIEKKQLKGELEGTQSELDTLKTTEASLRENSSRNEPKSNELDER